MVNGLKKALLSLQREHMRKLVLLFQVSL